MNELSMLIGIKEKNKLLGLRSSEIITGLIDHIGIYDDVIIVSSNDQNVDILNKHVLTKIMTIDTGGKVLRCSMMIDDYIYLGCKSQMYRINKNTNQSTSIHLSHYDIGCMMQYD